MGAAPAWARVPGRVPVGAAARFGTPRWRQGLAGAGGSALSTWGRVALLSARDSGDTACLGLWATLCHCTGAGSPCRSLGRGDSAVACAQWEESRALGWGGHRGWCHRLRLGWGGTEQGSVVTSLLVALMRCQPQRGVPHHSVLPQVCSVLRSPPSTSPQMPPCAGTRRRHRRDSRGWAQPPGRRRRRRRNRRAQPYDSVPVPKLILAAPRGQHQPPAPRATGTPVSGGKAPGLGGGRCSLFHFFFRLIQTLPFDRVPAPPRSPQHPRSWGDATTSSMPRQQVPLATGQVTTSSLALCSGISFLRLLPPPLVCRSRMGPDQQ